MSDITHIDSHQKRRYDFLFPVKVRRIFDTLDMPNPDNAYGYNLKRRNKRVEIFILFHSESGSVTSVQLNYRALTFKEARLYIHDLQERFLLNLKEIAKPKL